MNTDCDLRLPKVCPKQGASLPEQLMIEAHPPRNLTLKKQDNLLFSEWRCHQTPTRKIQLEIPKYEASIP